MSPLTAAIVNGEEDLNAWSMEALRRCGISDAVLTDNAKVFTARFGPYPTEVLFDRICNC